jgi:hypothetical protein
MADEKATLQNLIGKLKDFFDWANDALSDDLVRSALLEDLGLEDNGNPPPPPNIPQDRLVNIERYRQSANPDKEILKATLADIRAVFDSTREMISVTRRDGMFASVPELVNLLWDTLAINYVRIHYPRLYVGSQLLGFIEETISPHVSGRLYFSRFVDLCSEGLGYLKEHWEFWPDNGEQAQFMSDLFFTKLAALFAYIPNIPLVGNSLRTKESIYGWDNLSDIRGELAYLISTRMATYSFVNIEHDETSGKETENNLSFTLAFVPKVSHIVQNPGLFIALGGGGQADSPVSEHWRLIFKMNAAAGTDVFFKSFKDISVHGPEGNVNDIHTSIAFESIPQESGSTYQFPSKNETHIKIGRLAFSVSLTSSDIDIKTSIKNCFLVLAAKDHDSFISSFLPDDDFRIPFNFGIGYSSGRELYTEGNIPWLSNLSTQGKSPNKAQSKSQTFKAFTLTEPSNEVAENTPSTKTGEVASSPPVLTSSKRGGNGFNLVIPISRTLGPVSLYHLLLKLSPTTDIEPKKVVSELSTALGVQLGPVFVSINGLGFKLSLAFPDTGANLGFVDLSLGYMAPNGVGISIDAKAVTGGGFLYLDSERGQYAGVLQLNLEGGINVKAVGLIATRLPDNAKGYSLLIIITEEGFGPCPLPLGFKLTGIGGLLAINRSFAEEEFRVGLKSHALDSIMFPKDPAANAPRIINKLNALFPVAEGLHLFGLLAQIEWSPACAAPTLIYANIGVIFEFKPPPSGCIVPRVTRILILAQIEAILPKKDNDLIRLKMDAMGILDFNEGTVAIDAVLYDSRLVKKFVLTGEMAMRLKWEGSPNFALAVGGLHPAFNPPPAFPKLERIALNLTSGDNPRFRCEAYYAITSNTIQFGAHAELYAEAYEFSIQGQTGFDVLIQFDPFYFIADYYAQVQLKYHSHNLFKVSVEGALSGPRPLHIRGKATFEFLWSDHSIRFDKTLVEGEKPPLPEPIDVLPRLIEALENPANWVGKLPEGQRPFVTLRTRQVTNATELLIHPLGTLTVRQSVVPLNQDITRFGHTKPAGEHYFSITGVSIGVDADTQSTPPTVTEYFARAQYFEMSDHEKLSSPSFEPLPAGVMIGADQFVIPDEWLEVEKIDIETYVMGKVKEKPKETTKTEDYILKDAAKLRNQALFGAAGNCAIRRTGHAKYLTNRVVCDIVERGWDIVDTSTSTIEQGTEEKGKRAISYSETLQRLHNNKEQNPIKGYHMKIIRDVELL